MWATKLFTVISLVTLVASVVTLVIETLPKYREVEQFACSFANGTSGCLPDDVPFNRANCMAMSSRRYYVDYGDDGGDGGDGGDGSEGCTWGVQSVQVVHQGLYTAEAVFIGWFTFELVLRLLVSPAKWQFCKDWLNIIDLIAIVPFFVGLAMPADQNTSLSYLRAVRLVRAMRVLRIFKVTRHSAGMQILGEALALSRRELTHLLLFTIICTVLFSSAIYYAEFDEMIEAPDGYSPFSSIPLAFWWSIQTMTTLGYGDLVPQTLVGRLIATACLMSGVVVLALPVPIFVRNFSKLYEKRRKQALERTLAKQGNEPGYNPDGGMLHSSFARKASIEVDGDDGGAASLISDASVPGDNGDSSGDGDGDGSNGKVAVPAELLVNGGGGDDGGGVLSASSSGTPATLLADTEFSVPVHGGGFVGAARRRRPSLMSLGRGSGSDWPLADAQNSFGVAAGHDPMSMGMSTLFQRSESNDASADGYKRTESTPTQPVQIPLRRLSRRRSGNAKGTPPLSKGSSPSMHRRNMPGVMSIGGMPDAAAIAMLARQQSNGRRRSSVASTVMSTAEINRLRDLASRWRPYTAADSGGGGGGGGEGGGGATATSETVI